jgi:hypothetical protein
MLHHGLSGTLKMFRLIGFTEELCKEERERVLDSVLLGFL